MKYSPILYLILLTAVFTHGQSVGMTRNLANAPLDFLTHKDSLPNIHPINSGRVYIDSDTINLKDSVSGLFGSSRLYEGKIKTYLLVSHHNKNGLYVTLDFVYDRLYQINLYTNESYYLSNFKLEIERHFKKKSKVSYSLTEDSTLNYGHMIVTYGRRYSAYRASGGNRRCNYNYSENLVEGNGILILTDRKVSNMIPSWCGTCNGNRSWEKLQRYINKRTGA